MRIFVYIIVFFSFFDLFTQLPIMTPLANSLGGTPFLTGLAVGLYSFSNTIGNVASGFWTDKKGPFINLVLGLFLSGIMLAMYYLADNIWTLLTVRFLHGLTAGLIVPAAFTYLANSSAAGKSGKGAALSGAFVGLAAMVGPAFSGIMASRTSEVSVLMVTSIIMIVLGAFSLAFLHTRSNSHKRITDQRTDHVSVRFLFQNSLIVKAFVGALILMFSQGVLAYMLPLKVVELGHNTQTSGLLLSTFAMVAILVFVLPTNNIFDRKNPTIIMTIGMATMGLSLLLISLSQTVFILYFIMALYGIGFSLLFPALNSLLIVGTKPTYRGKAYGYFYAFFSIGVLIGSGLTGLLELSANGGFLVAGCLMIAVALLMMRSRQLPPERA